jgi:hypothetical protein
LLVSPLGFLRSLLTFACIGVPLIWLGAETGRGIGSLLAHAGLSILYFVWTFKVLGRFADAGRASNWYWFPFCISATILALLALRYKFVNGYEALALFLLIQGPLALLPSDRTIERPTRAVRAGDKYKKRYFQRHPDTKPMVVGGFAFLVRVVVIVCLWGLLLQVNNASGDDIIRWAVRSGYAALALAWAVNVGARFEDAGLTEAWYASQCVLVVSVASLMPLVVRWVNGYGSLAIFLLIQTPLALLKSPREKVTESC